MDRCTGAPDALAFVRALDPDRASGGGVRLRVLQFVVTVTLGSNEKHHLIEDLYGR